MKSVNEELAAAFDAGDVERASDAIRRNANPNLINKWGGLACLGCLKVNVSGLPLLDLMVASGFDVALRDADGWTLLHFAAYYNNLALAERLIHHGANPNAPAHNGHTPLFWAGEPEVRNLLAAAGARMDATDADGDDVAGFWRLRG